MARAAADARRRPAAALAQQLPFINYEKLCYLIKLTCAVKYGRNISLGVSCLYFIERHATGLGALHAATVECACAY